MSRHDAPSNVTDHPGALRSRIVRLVVATAVTVGALAVGPSVGSAFAGSFSISGAQSVEGGTLNFVVTCTNDESADCDGASVQVDTSPGTARAADFTSRSETLSFITSEDKTFSVATTQDALDEDGETLTATLSNPSSGSAISGTGRAVGFIADDDPLPALSVDDQGVEEGNNNVFTVTLNPVSGRAVTVDVLGQSGSALLNDDFGQASPSTLTFNPGETSKQFSLAHFCDNKTEGDEGYTVSLTNAPNATFAGGRQQGFGRIFDSCTTSQPGPGPGPGPDTLPAPVLGSTFNVQRLQGEVFVSVPPGSNATRRLIRGPWAGAAVPGLKGRRFIPLQEARQVPIGSLLDTRRGTAGVVSARNSSGATQLGRFSAGVFQVLQSRARRARGLTELRLKGSSFSRCRTAGRGAQASAGRRIRRLRSNAGGRFRTRGRHSAATVRGTKWTTTDRCDGTLTTVTRGRVAVRDFRRQKTIIVTAGKRYLAEAR